MTQEPAAWGKGKKRKERKEEREKVERPSKFD